MADVLSQFLILFCIYGALVAALDVSSGLLGYLSVAAAAVFGIGAYVVGVLAVKYGCTLLAACVAAVLIAGVASIPLAYAGVVLARDQFALASLAFQLVVSAALMAWVPVTNGPLGIRGIPALSIRGGRHDVVTCAAILIAALLIREVFRQRATGRLLRGIRDNEEFCRALGRNTPRAKFVAISVTGMVGGLAGAAYAVTITSIDPTAFTVSESIFVLTALILGGVDTALGPIIGTAVLLAVPEALRFLNLPGGQIANLKQIIYAGTLIVVAVVRPRGVTGGYEL